MRYCPCVHHGWATVLSSSLLRHRQISLLFSFMFFRIYTHDIVFLVLLHAESLLGKGCVCSAKSWMCSFMGVAWNFNSAWCSATEKVNMKESKMEVFNSSNKECRWSHHFDKETSPRHVLLSERWLQQRFRPLLIITSSLIFLQTSVLFEYIKWKSM